MMKSLRELRLRANPGYELVLLDRLSGLEQQVLEGLKGDPDCYGILRPRNSGKLTIKAASREAALLFFTLQEPGLLPGYAARSLGEQCDRTIGQMVLDGILEIEVGDAMLSGPSAHAYIWDSQPLLHPKNFVTKLSRRALQYGGTLGITDASLLSAWLYNYNRLPATPRLRQLLPNQQEVERHLGVGEGAARKLSNGWTRLETGPWLAWQSRNAVPPTEAPEFTYKLYVSPAFSALREAFQASAEVAATSNARHFKVGSDLYGLLRPDKMVLYFSNFAELKQTAKEVLQKLSNCPVHGVPFTSELEGRGLLSWGIDPPSDPHTVPWLERESWRVWIANRLASALIVATSSNQEEMPPWRFALERLRLEGVDTQTWTPSTELFRSTSFSGESYGPN